MRLLLDSKMLIIFILGMASGLPWALTASTLSAMLEEGGVDIATIGLFGAALAPHGLKSLWSPLVDNIKIPLLYPIMGHRRSWLIVVQPILMGAIFSIGSIDPASNISLLAYVVIIVAFLSATQDIVVDAFRIELLEQNKQGMGAGVYNFGYRIGMMISGAGALYLASIFDWKTTYSLMPITYIPSLIILLMCKEPNIKRRFVDFKTSSFSSWLRNSFVLPFSALTNQQKWIATALLIVLYRFSDSYLEMISIPFLIQTGFTKIEIAQVVKLFGLIVTIAGCLTGGYLASKFGIKKLLVIGIILQPLSNLAFAFQAIKGYDMPTLIAVISTENFCSGIAETALLAFVTSITNRNLAATQFAFYSSLYLLGITLISSSAGFVVEIFGWIDFFFISTLLSLPAMFLLYYINNKNIKY